MRSRARCARSSILADTHPQLLRLGDSALLLRWPGVASTQNTDAVQTLQAALLAAKPSWLQECVPAYASLGLLIEPGFDGDPLAAAHTWLEQLATSLANAIGNASESACVEIPVCYDEALGPDLQFIAESSGLSVSEVIECHSAPTYRVAMLGFAPGFPYLIGLDARLASSRLASPRASVAAGSVGIGGSQTGVYPQQSPGGWRLVGRTPLILFDPDRAPACLLSAGDRVRFVPIDRIAFDAVSR